MTGIFTGEFIPAAYAWTFWDEWARRVNLFSKKCSKQRGWPKIDQPLRFNSEPKSYFFFGAALPWTGFVSERSVAESLALNG